MTNDALYGIDLGTTNSCIAVIRNERPEVIEIEEGSAIVPSVVSLDEATGRFIVGRRAKNRLSAYPELTVRSVKRRMGRDEKVALGNLALSPEQVSAHILTYLAEEAGKATGCPVKKVVITVPAFFNDAQRRATIKAGELAGLEVVRIVNEPTAASLVYDYADDGEELPESPYVLVYDLGGGTFDVSILKLNGEIREVLASCGDTALGGDDFDERLADHFARHLLTTTDFDARDGGQAFRARLCEIAEKVKIRLSDESVVRVAEVGLHVHDGKPLNLDLEVGRREYEAMIGDLAERTIDKVGEALREASLTSDDIGRVILVGGATRTPLIIETLSEMFDTTIAHCVDPDLCVALGAAVQHGIIAGEPLDRILLDVTAHSLGIKTIDSIDYETGEADYFSTIIRRNSRIPAKKSELYFTSCDNQKVVEIQVFQGESHSCRENSLIGAFTFDLKAAPEGSPLIAELSYDRDGIIHVVVEQKGYNNRREVTMDVRACSVAEEDGTVPALDEEVVNYMVQKAQRLATSGLPEDLRRRLDSAIEAYMAALRDNAEGDDVDDFEDTLLELMDEAEKAIEERAA
jgi:molecular chaperone DnaK